MRGVKHLAAAIVTVGLISLALWQCGTEPQVRHAAGHDLNCPGCAASGKIARPPGPDVFWTPEKVERALRDFPEKSNSE